MQSDPHVLELRSAFLCHAIPQDAAAHSWDGIFKDLVQERTCLAEIQVIKGTGHARGMLGMLEQQLATLDAPSWAAKPGVVAAIADQADQPALAGDRDAYWQRLFYIIHSHHDSNKNAAVQNKFT